MIISVWACSLPGIELQVVISLLVTVRLQSLYSSHGETLGAVKVSGVVVIQL